MSFLVNPSIQIPGWSCKQTGIDLCYARAIFAGARIEEQIEKSPTFVLVGPFFFVLKSIILGRTIGVSVVVKKTTRYSNVFINIAFTTLPI